MSELTWPLGPRGLDQAKALSLENPRAPLPGHGWHSAALWDQHRRGFSGTQGSLSVQLAGTRHWRPGYRFASEAQLSPLAICGGAPPPPPLPYPRVWVPGGERVAEDSEDSTHRPSTHRPSWRGSSWPSPPDRRQPAPELFLAPPSLKQHIPLTMVGPGPFVPSTTQAGLPQSANPPGAPLSCKDPFALFTSWRSCRCFFPSFSPSV